MNKPARGYFLFFRSYYEAISDLDDKTQLELYRSIVRYSLDGVEPALEGIAATIWKIVSPILRNSRKQYENGLKGGAPKGNTNAKKWKKPTFEEVEEYAKEKGYNMDAQRFLDWNETTGWVKAKGFKNWQEVADMWWQKIVSGEYEN